MKFSDIENKLKGQIEEQELNVKNSTSNEKLKETTWSLIQKKQPKKRMIPLWYMSAAAVLLIAIASFSYLEIQKREHLILSLHQELDQKRDQEKTQRLVINDLQNKIIAERSKPKSIDTVYQTKIVYKQITQPVRVAEEKTNDEAIDSLREEMKLFERLPNDVASIKLEHEPLKNGTSQMKFKITYN